MDFLLIKLAGRKGRDYEERGEGDQRQHEHVREKGSKGINAK